MHAYISKKLIQNVVLYYGLSGGKNKGGRRSNCQVKDFKKFNLRYSI